MKGIPLSDFAMPEDAGVEFFKFEWLLDLLKDFFFWIVQIGYDLATSTLNIACSLMPSMDIDIGQYLQQNVQVEQILSFIAWIFPFEVLLFCIGLIGANYIAYFSVGVLLRWVKVIS